jgi:hypothetical protein
MVGGLTMGTSERAALLDRLSQDPHVGPGGIVQGTDRTLSIGAEVLRPVWNGQVTTAVDASADLHAACGALLDALALLTARSSRLEPRDCTGVNLLVDRPPPAEHCSEAECALRTLRATISGVTARVWYRAEAPLLWVEDALPPPNFDGHQKVKHWVDDLLLPRLQAQPPDLAAAVVGQVNDQSLQLYPARISAQSPDRWSLRLDGLEIGCVTPDYGELTVGAPGKNRDGGQRAAWLKISVGRDPVTFTLTGGNGMASVEEAGDLIRQLIGRWRRSQVPGAPVCHRSGNDGEGYVDEHALEARVLKGLIPLSRIAGARLICGDDKVARGSQFPTLWSPDGRPRYLDALLGDARSPLAVELKVARGGQGRYYRRSLVQAVLYRHFISTASGLDPWFRETRLDRRSVHGLVGIPEPIRWTERFRKDLQLLRGIAGHLGVEVEVLDDRRTPEYDTTSSPEPAADDIERLSWSLAGALSRRWPSSLGRIVHVTHEGGGQHKVGRASGSDSPHLRCCISARARPIPVSKSARSSSFTGTR